MKVTSTPSLFLLLISSALSEELYPCEQDATGRFYVEGTEGNGMRYCDIANGLQENIQKKDVK